MTSAASAPPADLRHIWVFLVLADELHFARTAQRCDLSPSRVSQTVRALERAAGAPLFDRTSRRVELTPVGRELRDALTPAYARIVTAFEHARRSAVGTISGVLTVGVYMPVAGGPQLGEIVAAFEARYPACRVRLADTGVINDMLDPLRHGEVDLTVVRRPVHQPDVVVGPTLTRETRVIAVSDKHPLASRTSIRYDDLADETLTHNKGFSGEVMDAFIPPLTSDGRRIRRAETTTYNEIVWRVASGELIHPTVASFVDYHRYPGVVAVPVEDLPVTETALAWLRANTDPKVAAFVALADNFLNLDES